MAETLYNHSLFGSGRKEPKSKELVEYLQTMTKDSDK